MCKGISGIPPIMQPKRLAYTKVLLFVIFFVRLQQTHCVFNLVIDNVVKLAQVGSVANKARPYLAYVPLEC